MTRKRERGKVYDAMRVVVAAILTALALCVPALALADGGATSSKASDPATSAYTPTAGDSGYVWTDKSVYTDGAEGITVSSADELLVALSLLSSSTQGDPTTTTTPLDIVLLLDVSGSMDERMSGSTTRLAAMKSAVNKFIDQTQAANAALAEQGSDVQHEVSIVKIGGNKTTKVGNDTYRDGFDTYNYTQVVKTLSACSTVDDASTLKTSVNALTASGATSIDYALELAQNNVLNNSRTGAKKVVVLFTDGAPTHGSGYSSTVAASAVNTAKALKDGGTIVYSIGIFSGADPSSTSSNENKFMNAVSSNYPNAYGQRVFIGWEIVLGNPIENKRFYKAAADASSLENVFTEIAQEITTPDPVDPVSAGGSTPGAPDGVTFTDKLGSYMEVEDVKAIVYNGVTYTDKTVSEDGTTFTFTADVTGNYAHPTTTSLSTISITVNKAADAKEGDSIVVNVPTALVPFVYFSNDGTQVLGQATPLKVLYTVGLKDSAAELLASPDADMLAYIAANSDDEGVKFYTNAHYGAETPGTTMAVCYPSAQNAYYYNSDGSQKAIEQSVTKAENTTGTSALVSNETWNSATQVLAQLGNNGLLKKQQPSPAAAAITFTKTLIGRDSLEGEEFQFTFSVADAATQAAVDAGLVVLPEDMTAVATALTDGVAQELTSGSMLFKAAGTYVFQVVESGIPAADENGLTYDRSIYKVTFVVSASPDRSTLEITSAKAQVSKDGGQTYEDAQDIAFTNAYQAESAAAALGGTKVLDGRPLMADEFSFALAPADEATGQAVADGSVVLPESTTALNDASGLFAFGTATFSKAGVYSFKVTEVVPAEGQRVPGVTYDESEATLTVTVTDDTATGTLVAVVSPEEGIAFENSYEAESTTATIQGNKTLTGSRELAAGDFSFTVEPAADYGDAVVMPESTTATNDASGAFSFDAITFNAAGEYSFTVSEVVPAEGERIPGVTYDAEPRTVTVKVTDDTATGKLVAVVSPEAVGFTNAYQAESAAAALGGTKVLDGRPLMADEFSFALAPADEATGQAVADGSVVLPESTTALNDASGLFAFGTATFSKAGVYSFKVTEVVPAEGQRVPGVTYDESEATLTVTVTDDTATGTLVAVVSGAANFTNTYSADPVDATIDGSKVLIGRALQDGEFSVELDKDGSLYKTAVINGGAFSFTESYTLDDLEGVEMQPDGTRTAYFTYTLNEIEPTTGAQPDVTYDTSVYTVTVALTDDCVGHLSTVVTYSLNGEVVEAPVFTNTYRPSGEAYAELQATKFLTGRALAANEFSFIVTDASQTTVATGSNDEFGAVTFSKIAYDASSFTAEDENPDGTRSHDFWYTMSEVDNGHGGVTYDTTTYGVCVTLFDDGRGNLSTTVAYYLSPDAALDPSAVVFNNTYAIDDTEFTPEGFKATSALETTDLSGKRFSYQVKDASDEIVATGTSGANEEIEFGSIKVSGLGEHVYTITETLAGQTVGGVTMDDAVFYLHLYVTDAGDGTYAIEHWYADANDQVIDGFPTFNNSYDGNDVTFNPSATKLFEGRTLAAGEFGFAIYDVSTNQVVSTGVNDAEGNVEFGSIQYMYNHPENEVEVVSIEEAEKPVEGDTVEGGENAGNDSDEGQISNDENVQPDVSGDPAEPGSSTEGNGNDEVIPSGSEGAESGNSEEVTEGGEPVVEDVPAVIDYEEEYVEPEAEAQGIFEPSIAIADDFGAEPYQSAYDGDEPVDGDDPVEEPVDPVVDTPSVSSTDLGDHWYRIAEIIPSEAERNADGKLVYRGVVYDETYYLMKISVTDNSDGTISAEVAEIERHDANGDVTPVTVAGDNGMDNVTFSNSYKATVPAVVTIAGNKLVNGRDSIDGQFSFEVKDATAQTVATATVPAIAAGDSASFETTPISFSEVGQYVLTVSEVNGGQTIAGWTYDDTTFQVIVNVTDNFDGTLSAAVTYPESGIWFGNAYKIVEPTSVTFEGTKVLTGRDAAQGEFTFTVTDVSGSPVAAGSSAAAAAGEVAGITFGSLSFNEPGEYVFYVSENHGGETVDGVTYDGNVFAVKVVVADDGDGTVSAQVVYPEGGIAFQNAYAAGAATVVPAASKVLTGRALADGEFLFTVVNTRTNGAVSTGVNKADGTVAFDAITLNEPGTYEYTIREVAGTEANVTYDSKSYRMVVKVSDNLKGSLVAEVSYPDGKAVFTNTYTEPPAPTPTPTPIPKTGDDGNGTTTAAALGSLGALVLGVGLFVGLRRRANER